MMFFSENGQNGAIEAINSFCNHSRTHTAVSKIHPFRLIKNLASAHKAAFIINRLQG